MEFTNFFGLKYVLNGIGGLLLIVGSTIEPSIGVWVISLGGSLLTVALGKDRNSSEIIVNIVVGLFWGIFGSQVVHAYEPLIPQIAASFFLSMFGLHTTFYLFRNLKTSTFTEIVVAIVSRIVPWSKKE